MWVPDGYREDGRTRYRVNGATLTYLAGDTEGAYRIVDARRTVVVYPSDALTTLRRSRIIRGALAVPNPLPAAVGELVLAGLACNEIELVVEDGDLIIS